MQAAIATDSIELTAKELERSEFLEENQGLENERVQLVEERASLRADLTQKSNDATSRTQMAEEIGRSLSLKQDTLDELLSEMFDAGIEPATSDITLPSVGDAEKKVRVIERRLEGYGPVNMLAIEQYDQCQERLDGMKDDFKTLQTRRKHLLDVTEQLESQRKERLLGVLEKVNENFKVAYEALSDGGRGELFLENPKEPFKGGLELWAQPRGKSAKVTRHQLSGGEQSMAALALIFAIQDYDPSPFYYFDEVDQNLDGFNAERIAKMCRERSKSAQFIMVTLRKVSLRLADHHIGITHGGDGCSRRIVDFDKTRALELGAKALKEAKAAVDKNQSRIDAEAAASVEMPLVPESLETPHSLGGLLAHLKDEMSETEAESSTLASLSERTADMSEDIEERAEITKAILADEEKESESESEVEQIQITTDEDTLE
jgi:chromosome segregation protein